MSYFTNIIGQEAAKRKLAFGLDAYKKSRQFFPTLVSGLRGGGKTELVRAMRPHLTDDKGNPKPFLEINGASLKNCTGLVQKAFLPYQNGFATYFIDEAHAMDEKVKDFWLSILALDNQGMSQATFDSMDLTFDLTRHTFIFATNNPQQLTSAFRSRCSGVDLERYSNGEMARIVEFHCAENKISLSKNLAEEIGWVCRNTPRYAADLAKREISSYCKINGSKLFTHRCWEDLRKIHSIRNHGLTATEFSILKLLEKEGMTLTAIANTLALGKSVVTGVHEPFLMERRLIKIDGKRFITNEGLKAIKDV